MADPIAVDPNRLPKIFWYSCAYAIFLVSTGLAYTAFRSTNTSIEVGGAKLELQRALNREKQVIATAETLAASPTVTATAAAPPKAMEARAFLERLRADHEHQLQQQQQVAK